MNNPYCEGVIFIDCMCNSGVYYDENGEIQFGTPVRVAKILRDASWQYPKKQIQLYFNDFSKEKTDLLEKTLAEQVESARENFVINVTTQEGNELLKKAGYIQRKTMLYETGVEYGDYTMNHVQGCAHGCLFPCYAFQQKKRFGQVADYGAWLKPYLIQNTIQLLRKEIPKLKGKIQSVQLCFSTDPFMHEYDEICQMSLAAIQLLNANGIKCTVLTKGILPIDLVDKTRFPLENEYGITLISLDEEYRKKKEPYAATYEERLIALKALHDAGCKTWVSMEPYPTPNQIDQSLSALLEAVAFTDRIIFGRTNYCTEVSKGYPQHKHFYNEKAQEVTGFCKKRKIACHIKNKTITAEDVDGHIAKEK